MSDLVLNTQFRLPVDSLVPFQIMKQMKKAWKFR